MNKPKGSVIIVPGLGGTKLKFKRSQDFNHDCCNGLMNSILLPFEDTLWINSVGMIFQRSCFLTMIKPIYDSKSKTLSNIEGLETYTAGEHFGDVSMCKCMCHIFDTDYRIEEADYGENLINKLILHGYTANENLFTVGYDFRFIPYPNYVSVYFSNLKKLIEVCYNKSKEKTSLIGHSMGCYLINVFLNKMKLSWKNKYIKSFISVSPSYDGSPKSLETILSGNNISLNPDLFGSNYEYCSAQRTMAGIISMIPLHPQMYGESNKNNIGNGNAIAIFPVSEKNSNSSINVSKDNVNTNYHCKLYNVNKYKNGITDILKSVAIRYNQPEILLTRDIFKTISKQKIKYAWNDPNVKVYQIMTTEIETKTGPYIYDFNNNGFQSSPIKTGVTMGDGTIPNFGLLIPTTYKWKNIEYKQYPPTEGNHLSLFTKNKNVHEYIINVLSK